MDFHEQLRDKMLLFLTTWPLGEDISTFLITSELKARLATGELSSYEVVHIDDYTGTLYYTIGTEKFEFSWTAADQRAYCLEFKEKARQEWIAKGNYEEAAKLEDNSRIDKFWPPLF
jgi:hypothetical protein